MGDTARSGASERTSIRWNECRVFRLTRPDVDNPATPLIAQPDEDAPPESDGASGDLSALRARWAVAQASGHAGGFHDDMLASIEKLIGSDNPAVSARGRKLLCCAMCNLGPTPPTCATCNI